MAQTRCNKIAKSTKKRCKNNALNGKKVCFSHSTKKTLKKQKGGWGFVNFPNKKNVSIQNGGWGESSNVPLENTMYGGGWGQNLLLKLKK